MLYVHPAAAGQGVGTMLIDALEKLAAARGAAAAHRRRQRQRAGFLQPPRVSPQQRNTVPLGDEWLANTTMEKQLAAKERAHETHDRPPRSQKHHIVLSIVAIVVAVACAQLLPLVTVGGDGEPDTPFPRTGSTTSCSNMR